MPVPPTLDQLTGIFRDVFALPDLTVGRATTAADVPGWDSLKHIDLIVAIEDEFDFRFKSSELGGLADVGALVDIIEARVGAAG